MRISEPAGGGLATGESFCPSISGNGRFVAFQSRADDYVAGDSNMVDDVFVRDRSTGALELVSASVSGGTGNGPSVTPVISADGTRVAFQSVAEDLGLFDFNAQDDIYVYDRSTGTMSIASRRSNGAPANDASFHVDIAAGGRFVAFSSYATNLVAGDLNGVTDVFVHDLETGVTELVSVATGGSQGNAGAWQPSVSADGRFVAFASDADNLVSGDNNGVRDVFVRDRLLGTTERASLSTIGAELDGDSNHADISADGRYVAFSTLGSIPSAFDFNAASDVVVRDRQANTLRLVSASHTCACVTANGLSTTPSITPDGRYVAFTSAATDLLASVSDTNGSADIYWIDLQAASLSGSRASIASNGTQAGAASSKPSISDDGSQIAFDSFADNLIPNDLGRQDVFVRNEGPPFPELYCAGKVNSLGCVPYLSFEGAPSVSATEPFKVRGHDFLPAAAGLFLYGTNGRSNLNYHGGKLCVKLPFTRWLPIKSAQKVGAAPCSGLLSRNFNLRIQSGADPLLTAGRVVDVQWLQRDGADPAGFGDALSNGLEFTVGP